MISMTERWRWGEIELHQNRIEKNEPFCLGHVDHVYHLGIPFASSSPGIERDFCSRIFL